MRAQLITPSVIEPIISDKKTLRQKRQSGIYQILCKPTGKVYVGSAVWLAKRKRYHREDLLNGKHHNRYLQKAWNKYGPDAFVFSVLEYCKKENLTDREQYYIDSLNAADNKIGFNLQPKAYSNLGMIMPPEAKVKLSLLKKERGCTLSPLQIEELRERMKGNSFRIGIKHTLETRAKLKELRKDRKPALGMHHSEETRRKMSESRRGKPLSDKNRLGIAHALKGKHKTPEHNWNSHVAQAKIKPDQFERIKAEYIPGIVKMHDLAMRYGCCTQTICNIINGKRMIHP